MITKIIKINCCLDCPLIKDCKAWQRITPKQRFALSCSRGIKEFILKDCPLDDLENDDLF